MAAVDALTSAVDALTKAIDGLTKAIASSQLEPQRGSLTADKQENQRVSPPSPSDVDLGPGRHIRIKDDVKDKEEAASESEPPPPKETPSSPMPDRALSADISFVPCPPFGSRPVSVTNTAPSHGFCFALTFINCSFGGDQPLRFDNCIIDCVTFTNCHFEGTQFANSVLKDMKVADVVFSDSWWTNRAFTQEFITIGREQDDTEIFDGKREGLNDEIPAELQDSAYKDRRFREQDLGGYQQANS